MKIAAFNVENLFNRPRVFDARYAAIATDLIASASELSALFEDLSYSAAARARMLVLMQVLGILTSDTSPFVWLRRIRGGLIRRPRNGPPEIIATGRGDWIGWLEFKTEAVNEIAIHNTGRVIRDVAADVLAVVEAENRITLKMFSEAVLAHVNQEVAVPVTYDEVMLIDGNDERGIDVGLMTRRGHHIGAVTSHISDLNPAGDPIFSRDCPEYEVTTPSGAVVTVIPNHFKSKYGGNNAASRRRRRDQATRVAQIYAARRAAGQHNVVILGDLNDTPDSAELAPLLGTDLRDVGNHPLFDTGPFPGKGTHELGNDSSKIDYLLLSPALWTQVTGCGLFRMGNWPGTSPRRWPVYPSLTRDIHAASDHHLIWADIAL